MTVIPIKTFRSECVDNLVEILEHSLEKAKAGEFSGGGVILIRNNGSVRSEYSKSVDSPAIIAGCHYLAHDLMEANY